MNTIPQTALDTIKQFEGLRLKAYRCPAGLPTIGYGHLLSRDKTADLSQWPDLDQAEADRLLAIDAMRSAASVSRLITVPLTDNQRAALIDFVFNLGGGNLQASTLRKVINRGEYDAAPEQFMKWVHCGPVKVAGLVTRRQVDCQLWAD